jgi:hypothetical protein
MGTRRSGARSRDCLSYRQRELEHSTVGRAQLPTLGLLLQHGGGRSQRARSNREAANRRPPATRGTKSRRLMCSSQPKITFYHRRLKSRFVHHNILAPPDSAKATRPVGRLPR